MSDFDDVPFTNDTTRTMFYWVDDHGTFHMSPEPREGAVKLDPGETSMLRIGVNRDHGIAISYSFAPTKDQGETK